MSADGNWCVCIIDNDYEIYNKFPYPIRRIGSDKIISENIDSSNGYIRCTLNAKKYLKHVIIGSQFIPNPDNLPCLDHIDRNKLNNQTNNLRWCSYSDNCRNKSSIKNIEYEFYDTIPDEAIIVKSYSKYEFNDLYFVGNEFYFYNGIQYRKLHINERKNGACTVSSLSVDGKSITIYYSKFKREYGL